jgi:beta-lactam-binding protein with PASTA domain
MAAATRARTVGRKLVLVAALAATYGVFTVAAMKVALRARETVVPQFVGLDVAAAMTTGDDTGLIVKVDNARRFDPRIPAGSVAAQDPSPGTAVRRGRTVRVWISAGSRALLVPRLAGDPIRAAQSRLQADGLEGEAAADIRAADLPPDVVVAQDPPPGTHSAKVALLVNRGERAGGYVMPDLIGVPGDGALEVLRAAGLRVAVVGQQPYPGVPPGTVLRQHPPAGFQVTSEEPVSLEVSR